MHFMNKFFVFIIFLFLLLGVVGFWYWQENSYSKEILKLEILGPESAKAGQEIEYLVKFKNNGKTRLEMPYLVFEYPEHSLPIGEKFLRVTNDAEEIGTIYPGQEQTLKFKARLFGKEGDIKTAKAWLTYQPKNLNARYESKTTFTTLIEFVPIAFEFDLPSKIESGREISFNLNYFSSLNYPLSDIGITVKYPSGFQFIESSPRSLEKNNWHINSLNPTEGGRIEIKGEISGESNQQKLFEAELGIWQENVFVVLKETAKAVEIVEPSLDIFQTVNGFSDYNASLGDLLHYEIFFRNIGKSSFKDLFLLVRLTGDLFDFQTIRSDLGKYSPGDNSILWDWRKVPKLKFLGPGEEGKVEFWIEVKKEKPYTKEDKNLELVDRVTLSQTEKNFSLRVNSKLVLSQNVYANDEIFGNQEKFSTPLEESSLTGFTVVWQVQNFYNQIKNAKVKGTLPENVKLTGKILPEDASFTFDSQSREIIWDIGDLEPGQGIEEPFQLAFQLALSSVEVEEDESGEPTVLVNEIRLLGEDQWTEEILEVSADAIDVASLDKKIEGEEEEPTQ